MYDICCIGHITLDKIVTPRAVKHMAGGTAFYFSNAIRNMDVRYRETAGGGLAATPTGRRLAKERLYEIKRSGG